MLSPEDSPVNLQKNNKKRSHHTAYVLLHYLLKPYCQKTINDKLQGSVATYLRCGGIVKLAKLRARMWLSRALCAPAKRWRRLWGLVGSLILTAFLENFPVNGFWKSVKIWQNYGREFGFFSAHPVYFWKRSSKLILLAYRIVSYNPILCFVVGFVSLMFCLCMQIWPTQSGLWWKCGAVTDVLRSRSCLRVASVKSLREVFTELQLL